MNALLPIQLATPAKSISTPAVKAQSSSTSQPLERASTNFVFPNTSTSAAQFQAFNPTPLTISF